MCIRDRGISVTTVRALLEEMLRDGEVECTGLSASSGGRRAAQYLSLIHI